MCVQDAVGRAWFQSCPKGPANMMTVLSVAIEIAAGMSYLHDRGIIHGDLSAGEGSALSSSCKLQNQSSALVRIQACPVHARMACMSCPYRNVTPCSVMA